MLSFYPEFEAEPMENIEYVFLLDMSCSMKVIFPPNLTFLNMLTVLSHPVKLSHVFQHEEVATFTTNLGPNDQNNYSCFFLRRELH